MLAIRLQRLGRKGHPVYRVAVQEAQRHPSSGRVVAYVGSYDPHTKAVKFQTELVQKYLDEGAQPSPRVIKLLSDEKAVKLPAWVNQAKDNKQKAIRNGEKLRKNQPKEEPVKEAVVETPEVAAEPEVSESEEVSSAREEPMAEEPTEETKEQEA